MLRVSLVLALFSASLLLGSCSSVSKDAPIVTARAGQPTRATDQLAAGRQLFVRRCIECHSLPAINEHPASAWPALVSKMAGRAGLTAAEREAVLAYILSVRG